MGTLDASVTILKRTEIAENFVQCVLVNINQYTYFSFCNSCFSGLKLNYPEVKAFSPKRMSVISR